MFTFSYEGCCRLRLTLLAKNCVRCKQRSHNLRHAKAAAPSIQQCVRCDGSGRDQLICSRTWVLLGLYRLVDQTCKMRRGTCALYKPTFDGSMELDR